jgi:hypothetical protein
MMNPQLLNGVKVKNLKRNLRRLNYKSIRRRFNHKSLFMKSLFMKSSVG